MLVLDAPSSSYVASACSSPRVAHTDSRATKELAGCAGVSSALTNRSHPMITARRHTTQEIFHTPRPLRCSSHKASRVTVRPPNKAGALEMSIQQNETVHCSRQAESPKLDIDDDGYWIHDTLST